MKQVKLVSVIIPVFNAQDSIKQTLQAVLDQSYSNLEIIIINDGSKDSSESQILAFNDSRIIYLKQNNQGSPIAKNLGLSIAKGDYIQFLDADDIISYNKIFEQVLELEKNHGYIAVCDTFVFEKIEDIVQNNLIGPIAKEFIYTTSDTLDFVLNLNGIRGNGGMIQPNAYLTPTEIIKKAGNWSTLLARSPDDDSEFFLRVILNAKGILYCDKGKNYYRRANVPSLSQSRSLDNIYGSFLTTKLKFIEIFKVKKNAVTLNLYFYNLASYVYMYSEYFSITYPLVQEEMINYGIKKLPAAGGNNFKKVAEILGFKNTLKLRTLYKNL